MSIRKSITSLKAMRSQEKTAFAITWLGCKKNSGSKTLILFQTLTFFQMSLETSMLISRNLSSMILGRMCGLLNQLTPLKERESISLMILTMSM